MRYFMTHRRKIITGISVETKRAYGSSVSSELDDAVILLDCRLDTIDVMHFRS